jgi:trehalose 6-phosphate phosphatase
MEASATAVHLSALNEGWPAIRQHLQKGTPHFVFDFDGTLAPIAARPEDVAMRPVTRTLFEALRQRGRVTVLSGRSREVLETLVATPDVRLIGNHGAEWVGDEPSDEVVRLMDDCLKQLIPLLPSVVLVERKAWSLSLHWRGVEDPSVARQVTNAAHQLKGVRLVPGKSVLNITPSGSPNKADAVQRLLAQSPNGRFLFMGDDVTDEDAFALNDSRLISVRVGRRVTTAAKYFVRDQRGVDRFLRCIVELA